LFIEADTAASTRKGRDHGLRVWLCRRRYRCESAKRTQKLVAGRGAEATPLWIDSPWAMASRTRAGLHSNRGQTCKRDMATGRQAVKCCGATVCAVAWWHRSVCEGCDVWWVAAAGQGGVYQGTYSCSEGPELAGAVRGPGLRACRVGPGRHTRLGAVRTRYM
jgi:hypothetical protein